jgi:hypothetical protein
MNCGILSDVKLHRNNTESCSAHILFSFLSLLPFPFLYFPGLAM